MKADFGLRHDGAVFADQREPRARNLTRPFRWYNFQGLHDVEKAGHRVAVACLGNQKQSRGDVAGCVVVHERRFDFFSADDLGRDHHLDACLKIADHFQAQTVENRIVLFKQNAALGCRQDACDLKVVLFLPSAHCTAGAAPECSVDGRCVNPGPRQCRLQQTSVIAAEIAFDAAGLRGGFIGGCLRNGRGRFCLRGVL